MEDVSTLLARWQISKAAAREHIYRAKTARERERWHALWLLSRGWSAAQVAQVVERDPHTIGDWRSRLRERSDPQPWRSSKVVVPPPSSQSSKPR